MPAASSPPTTVVIDCDPGIDDAVALALAAASDELELRAVTTVAGNVPVALSTRNALRLLEALGRADVPVAAGAARALVRVPPPYPCLHGADGLGGVELPPSAHGPVPQHAVELLASVLRGAGRSSVTIAAIGPLTNIALLLALHPELRDRIGLLVVMGGSRGDGNVTRAAEFNAWADPEAAHRVLSEPGLAVDVVELEATRRATVDEATLAEWSAASQLGALLARMVRGYGDRGPRGWPLHDAVVVASLIDPALVRTRPASVAVATGTGSERGRTRFRLDPERGAERSPSPRLEVSVDLSSRRFRELLGARIGGGGRGPPPPPAGRPRPAPLIAPPGPSPDGSPRAASTGRR